MKRILRVLICYRIPHFVIVGVFLFFSRENLFGFIRQIANLQKEDLLYEPIPIAFYATFWLCWAVALWKILQNKRYKILTGRSYPADHSKFRKSYAELKSFFTKNDPYKMDVNKLPIEEWQDADGVILCRVTDASGRRRLVKRASMADGNLASFGLPGSGKSTTQAATSFRRFNSRLVDGGCGVLAISIKGDLLNYVRNYRRNIKLFTPDKVEGSCHYNPLEGVDKMSETERRSFAEMVSNIICPEEPGENADYFVKGARNYFCAIVLYLLYLHDTNALTGRLKFNDIVAFILNGNVFEITMTIKNSGCKVAGEYSNSYEGNSEKNVSGIYNHLCKCVRPFNTGALPELFDGEGNCISPDDLNAGDIVIDVPQDKYSIYAPAMAIIISNFLMAFMRRDDVSANKNVVPILFLLDEAVQLNLDFSILSQAMSTLRSKKVSIFLLMQSVAQLEGRYGEAHAREIIDLCAFISVFNAQDPKSRRFFQELVGKRKMLKRTTSISSTGDKSTAGTSITEDEEYIFEAADFGDLSEKDKKHNIELKRVLVYANGKYILGETTPCYE